MESKIDCAEVLTVPPRRRVGIASKLSYEYIRSWRCSCPVDLQNLYCTKLRNRWFKSFSLEALTQIRLCTWLSNFIVCIFAFTETYFQILRTEIAYGLVSREFCECIWPSIFSFFFQLMKIIVFWFIKFKFIHEGLKANPLVYNSWLKKRKYLSFPRNLPPCVLSWWVIFVLGYIYCNLYTCKPDECLSSVFGTHIASKLFILSVWYSLTTVQCESMLVLSTVLYSWQLHAGQQQYQSAHWCVWIGRIVMWTRHDIVLCVHCLSFYYWLVFCVLSLLLHLDASKTGSGLLIYRGADKSLARPTSRCILFDGKNISFNASLVIYLNSTNIPPIIIINWTNEHQNLLSLYLFPSWSG
jgi:hypothetical protein